MRARALLVTLWLLLVAGCALEFDPSLLADAGAPGTDAAADCGPGRQSCAGACVSTSTSKSHCGECFNSCPGKQVCCGGDCRGNCQ